MFSIIIPAHNEAQLIRGCLDEMVDGLGDAQAEIIVVANGCSDRTAEIAATYGPPVRVIETRVASKSEALRLGDEAASGFPRLYVDADVRLSGDSIVRVVEALGGDAPRAAAPRMRVDTSASSWAVRAYYAIWTRLPYHEDGMIGSGVYAMNAAGRDRFGVFPDIISDDGFARLHFARDERETVAGSEFVVRAPRDLAGVLKIKTRSQKGLVQLHRLYPTLRANDARSYRGAFASLLGRPSLWPSAAVYLYVIVRTKLRAYYMNYVGDLGDWERDESSRGPGRPAPVAAGEESPTK